MKPGTKDQFMKEVVDLKIDEAARKDPGNLAYDYYSAFYKDEILLFELWTDEASLMDHQTTPHNLELQKVKAKYVLETKIRRFDAEEVAFRK